MRVIVLGSGPSTGVPMIGNRWGACNPADPRNRRTRPSILVQAAGMQILVDTSPDLREQLLRTGIESLDAVLYTHAHADHAHGLDDLRGICRLMQRPLPCYALAETLEQLQARFGYAFKPLEPDLEYPFYRPVLCGHAIAQTPFFLTAVCTDPPDPHSPTAGVRVHPFLQDHGFSETLGFRIGAFAYSTDVLRLDETAFAVLAGVDTWVVDCTADAPHPVHAHLELALEWIARLRPRRAVLTHLSVAFDYEALQKRLPPGVEPAYDGLVLEIP